MCENVCYVNICTWYNLCAAHLGGSQYIGVGVTMIVCESYPGHIGDIPWCTLFRAMFLSFSPIC